MSNDSPPISVKISGGKTQVETWTDVRSKSQRPETTATGAIRWRLYLLSLPSADGFESEIMNAQKWIALGAAFFLTLGAQAQLSLTGTNYAQNFDGLDSGLPAGWMVCTNAHATNVGTAAGFVTNHTGWSSASGTFGNYASLTNNAGTPCVGTETTATQSAITNRALGIRQTGAFGDPGAAFILNITNTTGMANFQLGLDFLMLSVQSRSTVWTVDYAVGNSPTNFIPLAVYTDPGVFGATHTNISLGRALDNQGSNVWIRIAALSGSTGSGTRDTFGVDNVSLSWTTNTAVTAIPPIITGFVITNGNALIYFTGGPNDTASSFLLQASADCCSPFCDTNIVINQLGSTQFEAVCGAAGTQQFYRVKHL
jgi:hypothetical protein